MAQAYTETSGGNMTFYTLHDGYIVNRVQVGTEGAVSRAIKIGDNEGKIVWEVVNNAIGGMITGGGIEVKVFGGKKVPEVQVMLDDDAMLQIPMYMLKNIAEVLPNIDRTLPVKIRSYKSKKGKVGLDVSQEGTKISSHFTEWIEEDGKIRPVNKNGLPEPEYDDIAGWDFRDHDKFLMKVVMEFFEDYAKAPSAQPVAHEEEDEVPF